MVDPQDSSAAQEQQGTEMPRTAPPYTLESDRLIAGDSSVGYSSMVGAVIDGTRAGKYGVRIQYVPGDVTDILGRETKSIKYVAITDLDKPEAVELLRKLREQHVNITDYTGGQLKL